MVKMCILSSVHIALDNRVFYRQAQTLRRAGYDVTVIAVHHCDESKDGISIVGLPAVARWQRPLLWTRVLRRALATGADLYLFHDPELLLVTPWLRLLTGKPTIYDVHEAYPEFIQVKDYLPAWVRVPVAWAFRWAEPLLSILQSGLFFADDQIAGTFEHVDRPKATLFNFPSESFVRDAIAATRHPDRHEPVVIYLGGLERNRGSSLMLEAFARVLMDVPDARLLIVGHLMPPGLEDEVRAHAARLGIDGCLVLTGRVPFEEVGRHLCRASVGWIPWQPVAKNQKNIPTKLFEYLAYGLPVVSSDLLSTRPFLGKGDCGLLVRAEDPGAHAEAIVRLLQEPTEASAMGRKGQDMVSSRYNWGHMEPRLLAVVEALL